LHGKKYAWHVTQSYNSHTKMDASCLDSKANQWAEVLADVDHEDEEEEFDL
jgi:hypothetical protein